MIFAYFDASGTHAGSKVLSFGGLLGTGETWDQLNVAWALVLERHALREFHSVDCVNHTGEFENRSFAERLAIMGDFIDALQGASLVHIGWALTMDGWNKLKEAERERLGNDAWALGIGHCIHKSAVWTYGRSPPDNQVSFVFDDENETHAAKALSTFLRLKNEPVWKNTLALGALAFASSEKVQALQAADLFAYCINRAQTKKLLQKQENFPVVKAFERLQAGVLKDGGVQTFSSLKKVLRAMDAISSDGDFPASILLRRVSSSPKTLGRSS